MFDWLSRIILRKRYTLLILIGLITGFMAWQATKIQLSYDFAKILPSSDPDFQAYAKFKQTFGEDGSVMFLGIEDTNFYQLQKFNDWYSLGEEIKQIDGIEAVVSVARLYQRRRGVAIGAAAGNYRRRLERSQHQDAGLVILYNGHASQRAYPVARKSDRSAPRPAKSIRQGKKGAHSSADQRNGRVDRFLPRAKKGAI